MKGQCLPSGLKQQINIVDLSNLKLFFSVMLCHREAVYSSFFKWAESIDLVLILDFI